MFMKKVLFFGFALTSTLFFSQVLESDNFETYPLGDVATDLTGAAPGDSGFYIYGGAVSDYQFSSIDAGHGISLTVKTPSTAGSATDIWKDGIISTWPTRTSGNNILVGTMEIYTGTLTGGIGSFRSVILDGAYNKYLTGIGYDYATQKIIGYAYYKSSSTAAAGNKAFSLGANTYPPNTWVTVAYTFNFSTGAATWTTPEGTFSPPATYVLAAANIAPAEMDFLGVSGTGNTVAMDNAVDNYVIQASNTTSLATHEATSFNDRSIVSIYPNPTSDFVNVQTKSPIKNVKIFDGAGKMVTSKSKSNQLDVRNLSKGVYIINVETENGIQSLKFIKK